MRPQRHFITGILFLGLAVTHLCAQDWPQWRGSSRTSHVSRQNVPATWPSALRPLWRVEVGEGLSSPVAGDSRVFVHSRKDPDEIVTALDVGTGRVIWREQYAAAFQKNQYAVSMAKGPYATPLLVGGRLITLGVTGILTAWDAPSGRVIWRKDFSTAVDTSKLFCGTAASPLLVDGLVVIQIGSDVRGGRIAALDPDSGAEKWSWEGPGPGYASPMLVTISGTPQIVTLTNSSIVSIDAKTGRQLWTSPFPDDWHENIVNPLWTGEHLVVSGTRQGTRAFRIALKEGVWQVEKAWANPEVTMYMSSPVEADGLIYAHSSKRRGQFVALDSKTGTLKWATEGREGNHASILLTPSHLIYLTNEAKLVVARRATPNFELEKKYDIGPAETWAVPVFLGTDVLVRDATTLIRYTGSV